MIECSICKRENPKRVVLKRYPLKDISEDLPEYLKIITKEYICINEISRLHGGKWVGSICDNRVLCVLK